MEKEDAMKLSPPALERLRKQAIRLKKQGQKDQQKSDEFLGCVDTWFQTCGAVIRMKAYMV
jgi:hypothetical protein